MFIMGKSIKPGFYSKHPSLTDLDANGDLKMTIDFRRVYCSLLEGWLGTDAAEVIPNASAFGRLAVVR